MDREGGGKNDIDVFQDLKVVTFRAAHHPCQRHISASLKRAHFWATPRPAQAEHPEMGLETVYFKRRTFQLILVHPGF